MANVGITGGYECIVICKPDMSAAASNGFHEMVMVCFPMVASVFPMAFLWFHEMVDINSSVFLTKLSMYNRSGYLQYTSICVLPGLEGTVFSGMKRNVAAFWSVPYASYPGRHAKMWGGRPPTEQ